MDDNQNEWGDEETLDTKKFRVSSLPHSLSVLQVVTRWVLSWKEQNAVESSRAEGPWGGPACPTHRCCRLLCKPACDKLTFETCTASHVRAQPPPPARTRALCSVLISHYRSSVRGAGDAARHGRSDGSQAVDPAAPGCR